MGVDGVLTMLAQLSSAGALTRSSCATLLGALALGSADRREADSRADGSEVEGSGRLRLGGRAFRVALPLIWPSIEARKTVSFQPMEYFNDTHQLGAGWHQI